MLAIALALGAGLAVLTWCHGDVVPATWSGTVAADHAATTAPAATPAPPPDRVEAELPHGLPWPAAATPGEPCTFAGTVTELRGGALAGANVELFADGLTDAARRPAPLAVAVSDAQGRFQLTAPADVPPPFLLRAHAPGHGGVERAVAEASRSVRFVLPAVVVVVGQVRSRRGAGLAGAMVSDGYSLVAADGNGRYRLEAVRVDGQVLLEATASGHAAQAERFTLHEARRFERDFELAPLQAFPLRVVDRATGTALAGAELRRADGADLPVVTDRDGGARIAAGPGEELELLVRAPDHVPLRWRWTVAAEPPPPPLRFPLARTARIVGRVLDADGNGVPAARVAPGEVGTDVEQREWTPAELAAAALPGEVADLLPEAERQSGDDGQFTLEVAAGGEPLRVHAAKAGFLPTASAPLTVGDAATAVPCDLVLVACAVVAGDLRRNGAPYDGYVHWRAGSSAGLVAADGGHYELLELPAGDVELWATDTRVGPKLAPTTLRLTAGASLRHDFVWSEVSGTIAGRVVGADGRPFADIEVRAFAVLGADGFVLRTVRTGADGGYVLEVPAAWHYDVSVEHERVERHRAAVAPGATGVDFVLSAFGELRVQFVDAATSAPLREVGPGQWGILWRETGSDHFVRAAAAIDATGLWRERVPTGRIDLHVALPAAGYAPLRRTGIVVTADGATTELRVALVRGVDLRLRFADAEAFAQLPPHALFVLTEAQQAGVAGPIEPIGAVTMVGSVPLRLDDPTLLHQRIANDENGVATVRALAPGRYRLCAFPDDLVLEPASVAVADDTGEVVVRWRRR
ncbi:MAG: hypothetical protein JNL08_11360 [Planctomycetes bacterium]|nr:hypothetical protein [Planctomycetota bacterium]